MGSSGKGAKTRHLHWSYFAPDAISFKPVYTSDGTAFGKAGKPPSNTAVSNVYGSDVSYEEDEPHEGIDQSGKIFAIGWLFF